MNDMMEHDGYFGSVHYSDEDRVFYGKLEFIQALVSYEGTNVKELRSAFMESVEEYLDLCRSQNRKPEKPFKGSFNVRVGSDLHRQLAALATSRGVKLNKLVTEALQSFLQQSA